MPYHTNLSQIQWRSIVLFDGRYFKYLGVLITDLEWDGTQVSMSLPGYLKRGYNAFVTKVFVLRLILDSLHLTSISFFGFRTMSYNFFVWFILLDYKWKTVGRRYTSNVLLYASTKAKRSVLHTELLLVESQSRNLSIFIVFWDSVYVPETLLILTILLCLPTSAGTIDL